jgi:hypothetical protein
VSLSETPAPCPSPDRSRRAPVSSALPTAPDGRQRFASIAERNAEIVKLAMGGLPPSRIEERLFVSRGVICNTLLMARRRGKPVPRFTTAGRWRGHEDALPGPRAVTMTRETLDALAPATRRRGLTVAELVRLIVQTVAEDGLVAAVLDDGEGP